MFPSLVILNPAITCERNGPECLRVQDISIPITAPELKEEVAQFGSEPADPRPASTLPLLLTFEQKDTLSGGWQ